MCNCRCCKWNRRNWKYDENKWLVCEVVGNSVCVGCGFTFCKCEEKMRKALVVSGVKGWVKVRIGRKIK